MNKLTILLLGPTIMIFLGLIVFQNVPITFALFYGWLLLVPLIIYIRNNQVRFISKNMFNRQSILVGLISGLIFLVTIYGAVMMLKDSVFDLNKLRQVLLAWNFTGNKVIWLILFLIFVNPFLEELYWRHFMYKRLINKIGTVQTISTTAFFYSLYHVVPLISIFTFPFNFIAVLPVFLAGLIWGYFRYKFKSITAPIISHILADLGIMLVYLNYVL